MGYGTWRLSLQLAYNPYLGHPNGGSDAKSIMAEHSTYGNGCSWFLVLGIQYERDNNNNKQKKKKNKNYLIVNPNNHNLVVNPNNPAKQNLPENRFQAELCAPSTSQRGSKGVSPKCKVPRWCNQPTRVASRISSWVL